MVLAEMVETLGKAFKTLANEGAEYWTEGSNVCSLDYLKQISSLAYSAEFCTDKNRLGSHPQSLSDADWKAKTVHRIISSACRITILCNTGYTII